MLYLGELNDSQLRAWQKTISVLDEGSGDQRQMALFPADRTSPVEGDLSVQVRLGCLRLEHPWRWEVC